jgi:hypothetical protein
VNDEYGYEAGVDRYLRTNQYGETPGVSPIFLLPPFSGLWHNYKAFEPLIKKEEKTFEKVYRDVVIDKAIWAGYYEKSKQLFDELSEKKKQYEEFNEIKTKWGSLLNVQQADELLNTANNQGLIENSLQNYNFEGEVIYETTEKMLCPNCNKEVLKGWKVCPSCTFNLQLDKCSQCGYDLHTNWKACPNCGKPI